MNDDICTINSAIASRIFDECIGDDGEIDCSCIPWVANDNGDIDICEEDPQ
jgi:hypothetical protein